MDNIELLLRECGARLEHIASCHVYLTDIRHREPVYGVLGERLRGRVPGVHRARGRRRWRGRSGWSR